MIVKIIIEVVIKIVAVIVCIGFTIDLVRFISDLFRRD